MKKTYAIVDLETTGTDAKTDRMIQFGCVLVEDGKIVSRFATDINPDQNIPAQIQTLTGITNARVKKAPYFEDIALTVANLLEDTIFVAHNIFFDYTFLSNELVRCGLPALNIPGIDTVELAQIFMPTALSFRLKDLADELNLVHENPHQADSDADVTGQLLLALEDKIKALPLITLEKILTLADFTAFQTKDYLMTLVAEKKQHQPQLSSDLEVVGGLALRKKKVPLFSQNFYQKDYPKMKRAKGKLYGEQLEFRREQARLMNLVYDFFKHKTEKNILVEAATGLGKTLGYLLPMSYLVTPEQPLVVSTASLLLQEQLLEKDLPLLNQLLEQKLQAVVMKSSRHYLDLARFAATLKGKTEQKQYAFYQMAVLVWLTETETGDFDELNLTSLKHAFWQDVCHFGLDSLNAKNPFAKVDFLQHRQQKLAQSNVIVTNHAFLAQESYRKTPALPQSPYLIIDEAHHLDQTLEQISNQTVSVSQLSKIKNQLMEGKWLKKWQQLAKKDQETQHQLEILFDLLTELAEDLSDFYQELLPLASTEETKLLKEKDFQQLSSVGEELLQRISSLLADGRFLTEQLHQFYQKQAETYSIKEQSYVSQFIGFNEFFQKIAESFEDFVSRWQSRYIHWLAEKEKALKVQDLAADSLKETVWYQRYQQILYLGGTLKIASDRQYFARRWGIEGTPLKVIPTPYDYQRQARLFLPTESFNIQTSSPEKYAQYIAEVITKMARTQQQPILVLFTSHDILNRVYRLLRLPMLQEGREILAQGTGGSREKLLKRFLLSKDGILLGADSFWEGVDLPGEVLQILIVTRLPFANPKRPLVKARNEYLSEQGLNPFYQEAVPHAALRLRQALGRLIRTDQDKGVMLLLDQRLLKANYGSRLQKALPKELPILALPFAEILQTTQQFLISDKNDEK